MIDIFHFHNGKEGGVFSVIKNLLKFSNNPQISNHIIFTINEKDKLKFTEKRVEGVSTQQVFYYSSKNNFYYTCKQLAKLLPKENAIIVAHDWLELGMVSILGLQHKVVYFLHGDYEYYYELAKKHVDIVDLFIPVAKNIEEKLLQAIPEHLGKIKYLLFPVPDSILNVTSNSKINIAFVGRLSSSKGYNLLPQIAKELRVKNIYPVWHIFGPESDKEIIKWDINDTVKFYGEVSNEEVIDKMASMKFFILPSIAEGMPVSIIEAMKAGVIPLVTNLTGGIQELVIDAETGFKIDIGAVSTYADKISFLSNNEAEVERMKNNCIRISNNLFNPFLNTLEIEKNIVDITSLIYKKRPKKVYGSRLDNAFIPNFITKFLRRI